MQLTSPTGTTIQLLIQGTYGDANAPRVVITFDDSAIFKIIEIEWVPFVSEFYSVFGVTTSLFLLIITQIIVFFKIRRKKH